MNTTAQIELYDIYDAWYTPWYQTSYFYGCVGIIVLGIIYLLYCWYKNRKVPAIIISPQERALAIIEELKKGKYENYQTCYTLLIQTLKVYLESYYKIPLAGQTDSEFLTTIASHPTISSTLIDHLKIIFDGAIFIKFAGQEMQDQHIKKALDLAEKIIKNFA
jgi:hypothetical protein